MSIILTGLLEEEFASSEKTNLYVDDVYRTHTYIGNGTSQDLDLGIDFTKHGGMVLFKNRDALQSFCLHSTLFGATKQVYTNVTNALETIPTGLTAFTNTGVSVGSNIAWNASGQRHVAWVFCEAPKFFTQKLVNHVTGTATTVDLSSLGTVGCVICKGESAGSGWLVFHRSLAANQYLYLNATDAAAATSQWGISGTNFTIPSAAGSQRYLVLGFAHDPSPDGLIQCGAFTGGQAVELGWEPQFCLTKTSNVADNWYAVDDIRGWTADGQYNILVPNTTSAQVAFGISTDFWRRNATGMTNTFGNDRQYIYIAIRRPNKPAQKFGADKVFCPVVRTGTGVAATVTTPGFLADTIIMSYRNYNPEYHDVVSRLRGGNKYLSTARTSQELTENIVSFDVMSGYSLVGSAKNSSGGYTLIDYAFRRAPGFFDEVCWAANGTLQTHKHGLAFQPGMMWTKARSSTGAWAIYHKDLGRDRVLYFDTSSGSTIPGLWGAVTGATFQYQAMAGAAMTTLLFGDMPGLCKAGSFTLGATPWTEACGFSPRLVILKRTDAAGDWYMWDTARGIVAGNDPYLLLNSTAAEVSGTDHIDPATGGFIINPTLPAGSYIYWACA